MATQPDVPPDTIEPQSPPELPPSQPDEQQSPTPDEVPTIAPDFDQPGHGPDEQPIPF
ncbi:MAG: hypothetical protein ABIT04_01745 [Novosphingobium sp.]